MSMAHEERCVAYPEILAWAPASGHPGGWRVVKYAEPPQCHLIELEDRGGRRRLFKSRGAAEKVADGLNGKVTGDAARDQLSLLG